MVIIDTNIIIDHIRQGGARSTVLLQLGEKYGKSSLAISVITVQELYTGKSTRELYREQELRNIVSPLLVLPYTYAVAQKAGTLIRDGCIIESFQDAAIAATALTNSAQLATLNKKDFIKVLELQLVDLN